MKYGNKNKFVIKYNKGVGEMIDLHIHSNYSDGTDNIPNILKKAEKFKLKHMSITDHIW